MADKHGFDVVVHRDGLEEQEAFALETALIRSIGRRDLGLGPLVNFTDGGEGTVGHTMSLEGRARMSEFAKHRTYSPETRAKMSASRQKRTITDVTRDRISASNKRFQAEHGTSEATKAKLSAAAKKRAAKPEERVIRMEQMSSNWNDPDIRAAIVEGMKKAWTPERRAKQAEIMRERRRKQTSIDSCDRSPLTP